MDVRHIDRRDTQTQTVFRNRKKVDNLGRRQFGELERRRLGRWKLEHWQLQHWQLGQLTIRECPPNDVNEKLC